MGKRVRRAVKGLVKGALFLAGAVILGPATLLGKVLIGAGLATIYNTTVSAFRKTPRSSPTPLNVTVRGTIEYRRIVFGTRRVGGVLVFYGVSGDENKYLWYVIAYAGHQSSAFHDFWLDERRVPESDIPSGAGGVVTANPWKSKLAIWKHLGTSTQTVDTNLNSAFGAWDVNHKLLGTTYAVIRFERDDEVYPDGAPQSVTCKLDGLLTYDARLDSTNGGSGSHRYNNPSTWAFSRDPVQHVRWYLTGGSVHNDQSTCLKMYGLKEADTRIDDAYTIAASNHCDEVLSGANAPPSGNQPRYRCDLEVDCGETRREILAALLATMAGTITYVHGKWRIYAGVYESPVHTLTQDDLYGELEVQDTIGHNARYNAVAPIFVDADQQYVQTTGKYRTDSSYETQDGGEKIPTELRLDGVTDKYQAQRLAEIHLRRSRMMRGVKLVGALDMMRVALYEGILYSHSRYSWSSRIFRCRERHFELNQDAGRVTIQATRDDPAVWADLLTADYDSGTSNTDVFQSDGPASPTNLVANSMSAAIEFVTTLPSYMVVGSVVELWEHTSPTPFGSATKVAEFIADRHLLRKRDTTTRYYWIRIRQPNGSVSGTYPSGAGLAAAADVVAATPVTHAPADGNITYPATTQPAIEPSGLNGYATATSPVGISSRMVVSWSGQAQVSGTTSGVAVGFAEIIVKVVVNGSQVYSQNLILESFRTSTNAWGTLAGSKTFDVPGGQQIEVYLQVGRVFSTSGSSPAQTIYWRAALIDILPLKG